MIELEHCRSCKAPIYMLRHHRTGKTAPIEEVSNEWGNVVIDLDLGTYRILTKEEQIMWPPHTKHLNHFASCVQAPQWRQFGKGGKTA